MGGVGDEDGDEMKMRRAGWVVIAAALLAASGANCGGSY